MRRLSQPIKGGEALTNIQLFLTIGIPTLAVLVGILVNTSALASLTGTINSRFGSLEARMTALETRLDARISSLEAKFETKFDILVGKVMEMDNRLTRLQERLKH
jgi:hypothetical protein